MLCVCAGYSLLPQVMAGFYQLPVPMTPVTTAPTFTSPPPCTTAPSDLPQQTGVRVVVVVVVPSPASLVVAVSGRAHSTLGAELDSRVY